MHRRRATAVLLVLFACALVAPVTASPRPVEACQVCGDALEATADRHGLDLQVVESHAVVRVDADGDATWTARVTPNPDAVERLRSNATLRRAVVDDVSLGRGATDVRSAVERGRLVVRYRTRDAAVAGPFDTLRFDYLRDDPGAYVYTDLGADRLTVVGPEGTTVAHAPGDATVDGRRATLTALPEGGPFVVFAPDGTPLAGLVGSVAVVTAIAGRVALNAALLLFVPGLVAVVGFRGVTAAVGRLSRRDRRDDPTEEAAAALLAVLGPGLVASPFLSLPHVYGFDPVAVSAGVAALGLAVALVAAPRLPPDRRLAALLVPGLLLPVVAVVALPAYHAVTTPPNDVLRRPLSAALRVVPIALAPAVGYAVARSDRTVRRVRWLAVTAVLLSLAVSTDILAGGGLSTVLGAVLAVGYAAVVVVAGLPLAAVGHAIASESAEGA